MNKTNLLKSAIAGAASAVGTHFADEALSPTPQPQWAYFAVAAAGAIGGYYFRKKPVVAGVLLGVGAGSAYQGYVRGRSATPSPPPPVSAPEAYVPPPAYQQQRPMPYSGAYAGAPPPASSGFGLPVSAGQLQELYGTAQGIAKQFEGIFGPGSNEPVPYSAEDYAADTAEFESDWG